MVVLFDQFNLPENVYEIIFATKQQVLVAKLLIEEMNLFLFWDKDIVVATEAIVQPGSRGALRTDSDKIRLSICGCAGKCRPGRRSTT